jgi:tRNA A37 threonylcarbamoyladenosine synthetase subunit TsaC/SUA5/YrdC
VVIDGGRCAGAPSTVVRIVDGHVEVLRAGVISARALTDG